LQYIRSNARSWAVSSMLSNSYVDRRDIQYFDHHMKGAGVGKGKQKMKTYLMTATGDLLSVFDRGARHLYSESVSHAGYKTPRQQNAVPKVNQYRTVSSLLAVRPAWTYACLCVCFESSYEGGGIGICLAKKTYTLQISPGPDIDDLVESCGGYLRLDRAVATFG